MLLVGSSGGFSVTRRQEGNMPYLKLGAKLKSKKNIYKKCST